ncbi:MAG: hypothetical protein WC868_00205 [Bacteroidales bacterium]
MKPYHIAPLACLIHEYQAKGFTVKLIKIPEAIKAYLESFHFDQFCKKENINNFPEPTNPKTLPLWRIEQTATSIYPQQAQAYFENNHFDEKSLFALSLSLAELMNNVFDHSESKIPGYTFTQFNSSRNEIITCVCDFGIGIPHKVNHYFKQKGEPIIDNLSALIKSFEIRFSTLSKPHNRGFGWDNIFSNIKSLKSKMLIISNNVLYWLLNNGEIKTSLLKGNFFGTSVVIYFDTRNLPKKEEELTDELIIL